MKFFLPVSVNMFRTKPRLRLTALCFAGAVLSACSGSTGPETFDAGAAVGVAPIRMASAAAEAYRKKPDDAGTLIAYSKALRVLGSQKKAVEVISDASSELQQTSLIAAELMRNYLELNKPTQAEAVARPVLAEHPHSMAVRQLLAIALSRQKNHTEAQELFADLYEEFPDHGSVLNNYALSLLMTKEAVKARDLLERAMNLPSADSKTRQNYALALGLTGDMEAAREMLLNDLPAVEADANIVYINTLLGNVANVVSGPLDSLHQLPIEGEYGDEATLDVKPAPVEKVATASLLAPEQPLTNDVTVGSDAGVPADLKLRSDISGSEVGVGGSLRRVEEVDSDSMPSVVRGVSLAGASAGSDEILRGTVGN